MIRFKVCHSTCQYMYLQIRSSAHMEVAIGFTSFAFRPQEIQYLSEKHSGVKTERNNTVLIFRLPTQLRGPSTVALARHIAQQTMADLVTNFRS